jgi:hypothetical protein
MGAAELAFAQVLADPIEALSRVTPSEVEPPGVMSRVAP